MAKSSLSSVLAENRNDVDALALTHSHTQAHVTGPADPFPPVKSDRDDNIVFPKRGIDKRLLITEKKNERKTAFRTVAKPTAKFLAP